MAPTDAMQGAGVRRRLEGSGGRDAFKRVMESAC